MAKRTLLEITQEILSDIDGDEVNSINDTVESTQVADMVRSTFVAMVSNRNWPHSRKFVSISLYSDSSLPTHLSVPDIVKEMIYINYNKIKTGETRKKYLPVRYKEPDEFLMILNSRDNTSSTVDTITDPSGIELLIKNDTAPTYYTSFDDDVIVFDSYDSAVDSTIQESKIQAYAYTMLQFTVSDTYIPDLPEEAFTSLIEEAKSKAAIRLKQAQDPKAEQESTRQRNWLSRKAWRVAGGTHYPNYGRNNKKGYVDPTFKDKN